MNLQVDLIWYSKLNLVKVLFFLSRYPVFADTLLSLYSKPLSSILLELSDILHTSWCYAYCLQSCEPSCVAIAVMSNSHTRSGLLAYSRRCNLSVADLKLA